MQAVFRGKTTNAGVRERKRKEKQDELGVCRIRRTKRDKRSQTLGSGFVVKDLEIIPGIRCPYCLISSDRVFPKDDCNIESYYLDFRKLESTDLKTIKLENVVAKSTDIIRTSGLVVIPIKPSKKCDKNQSIFTYRPFKVASVGITPDEDLVCHFVDDGPGPTNFSVKGLALKRSETVPTQFQLHEALDRPYTTYDEVTRKGDRKPYGAVILKPSNNEFMAGGALTFTDNECRNISSVFFPLPLVTQTTEPFSDGNEYPVSEQQVSVDNAPSIDVESPGVASAVKQDTPTIGELENLGSDIATDWKKLGRRLDVSDPKLEEIDHSHNQLSEKGYYMLKHWKQKKGDKDATYQALCDALQDERVQRRDLAEKFCYINGVSGAVEGPG